MMKPIPVLKIGHMTLDIPLVLAPLAGYSDFPFRQSVRSLGGVGLAFTEMLNPRSVLFGGGKRRLQILATAPDDQPLGYQIYGHDIAFLCDGARWLADNGARLIDINMGCPQRRIASSGSGAGLLRRPDHALQLAESVVRSVPVPVTVKLRLGWDQQSHVAKQMAVELEKTGVAAITIHGRTRGQGYSGEADLLAIKEVVDSVKTIPVIGNGDVTSPEKALHMLEMTGCAGLMIGRGALKNPWLLKAIWEVLNGRPPPPEPDRTTRIHFMRDHLHRMMELYGEGPAVVLFRKWIPQYAPGLRMEREKMIALLKITDQNELHRVLLELVTP